MSAMLAATTETIVLLPLDLVERLLAGLRARETPRGHLAQKVTNEGLGLCSWRSESPQCVEHHQLVVTLEASLADGPVARAVTPSSRRQALHLRCRSCNAALVGRADRLTCSAACRQAAYRRRRALR